MKAIIIKVLDVILVVIALAAAVFIGKNIGLEALLRGKENPVTLAMTETGLPEDFIGRPAGEDIPRIADAQAWEDTWATSYITIEPTDIVSTGIGQRHPWVSPYKNSTRRGGSRRRPDASRMIFDIFNEYGEYYLLQLPDESYILAQIPTGDASKLKAGKQITLPVGRKQPSNSQVIKNIQTICKEYDVDTDNVFYCINDQWNEEHELFILLLRFAVGAVVLFGLGTLLITVFHKLFKVKD